MNTLASHRLHWHDWGRSVVLHGVLVAALAWGMAHSPAPMPPSTRLDMPLQWAPAPAPAIPAPAPTPAPPEAPPPPPPARVPPAPPARVRPVPPPPAPAAMPVTPPLTPPATPSVSDAAATAADTVMPAAPVAAAPAEAAVAAAPAAVAPAPSGAQPQAAQQARWEGLLEAALREHKHYPLVARRMGQQGRVTVEAHFSAEGELLRGVVASSSGFKALDEAALQLVRRAADLVRASHQPGHGARLRIPIAYEFDES